jgi:predicted anti-sigma-YlaC factor YlaD
VLEGQTVQNEEKPVVEHLWSCEQCRNPFRLVETSDDRYETHFD